MASLSASPTSFLFKSHFLSLESPPLYFWLFSLRKCHLQLKRTIRLRSSCYFQPQRSSRSGQGAFKCSRQGVKIASWACHAFPGVRFQSRGSCSICRTRGPEYERSTDRNAHPWSTNQTELDKGPSGVLCHHHRSQGECPAFCGASKRPTGTHPSWRTSGEEYHLEAQHWPRLSGRWP